MRKLLFLSRVAFVCNIFFVISFSIQLTNWIKNEQVKSSVVVIGYVMALPLNFLINLFYLIMILRRKKLTESIPVWLITANILFLVIQILYIIYLNDPQHT